MRKIICLFLMLWLPISAGSAWAMSTQMQLDSAQGATSEPSADMPCHDMGMMSADHTDSSDTEHGMKHNCSACGACFSVFMAEAPKAAAFAFAAPSSQAALLADDLLVSQTYPPALRPPIAS